MKPIGVIRKVDQLGRIVLPKLLRKRFQMEEGDEIEILVSGEKIYVEKYMPRCSFCSGTDQVLTFKDRIVCRSCLEEIVEEIG